MLPVNPVLSSEVPTRMLTRPAGVRQASRPVAKYDITYVGFGLPLTVFMMAGYYRAMPRELIEAALVDGAGIWRVFFSITLPVVRNALVTIALVQFFFIWNDILLTLTFIRDTSKYTLQMGVLNFAGRYGQQDWGPTFAFLCISTAPTLLLYLILNQRVLKGMSAGAIKG